MPLCATACVPSERAAVSDEQNTRRATDPHTPRARPSLSDKELVEHLIDELFLRLLLYHGTFFIFSFQFLITKRNAEALSHESLHISHMNSPCLYAPVPCMIS
jgi:hypothetical protein